jgi:hypothetical protein
LSGVVTRVEVWCESRFTAGPMPCAMPCGRAGFTAIVAVSIEELDIEEFLHLGLPIWAACCRCDDHRAGRPIAVAADWPVLILFWRS